MTCLSSPQRRFYAAARTGQSLAQPLAGLKLSPGAAPSYQDVHVCWRERRMVGWIQSENKDISVSIEKISLVSKY